MIKSSKGITLVSLVVIIIVLLIIASISVISGIESYKDAQAIAFVSKLQVIQQRVNIIYQNNKNDFSTVNTWGEDAGSINVQAILDSVESSTLFTKFRLFRPDKLKSQLGLNNIDLSVLICFETREVISLTGIEYDGRIHYVQDNLPTGKRNVEYTEPTISLELDKNVYGLNAEITVTVKTNGNTSNNVPVVYKEENGTWNNVIGNRVTISKTGNYIFKAVNTDAEEKSINVTLCNKPVVATGMIPIKYNGNKWTITSENDGKWFDYIDTSITGNLGFSKWANVMLSDGRYKVISGNVVDSQNGNAIVATDGTVMIEEVDLGSMFVWIPRYMYNIVSGYHSSTAGEIDIKFLKGTTNIPTDNTNINISTTAGQGNWIVHPCFQDGTDTNFENGEWNAEVPGFWVAKYQAGYQYGMPGVTAGTVQYSNLKYTSLNGYTSNFLTTNLTKLSYPVFKANTYAYNMISVGDAYLLSKEMDTAAMYGLNGTVDSHLQKNSEWGAVAYLTHSKYGRNRTEVEINNRNLNNAVYVRNASSGTLANVYAITSYGTKGTPNDIDASTTKNMTGVFDLSGSVYELTANFYKGGHSNPEEKYSAMADINTINSSKYVTLYDGATNKKGDATHETAIWFSDNATLINGTYPISFRGGYYLNSMQAAGIFSHSRATGNASINLGFRVCLI